MENYSRDGHWRFKEFPKVAGLLVHRFFKRGQIFISRASAEPFPAPPVSPSEERKNKHAAQPARQGAGAFFYRRYHADFLPDHYSAQKLMAGIQANPDRFSPEALAVYIKTRGASGKMAVGDEFFIKLTGPWNGPVRVATVTETSFTLITLQDHMEAGQIQFSVSSIGEKRLRFEIQSWARSRDHWVDFAYDKIKMARMVQTEMWTRFSESVVRFSGAKQKTKVVIETQRIPKRESV